MSSITSSEYSDVEYTFEPHQATTPDVREYLRSLWSRWPFMVALAKADIRTARAKTRLGNLWSILNPLFQAAIYYFLYSVLRSSPQNRTWLPILIANFFFFGLSMQAIGDGGGSVKRAKGLVLNSSFPRAMLPLTSVYKTLREFVPSACVLAVIFPLIGGKLGPGLFLLPLVFVIHVVMNVGIALTVSTYVTLFPDGQNVMNFVSRILFFITPVIYPVALLPPLATTILQWQPLFPVFACYQAIFGGTTPNPAYVLEAAVWAVVLVVVGGLWFIRHEREFTMRI